MTTVRDSGVAAVLLTDATFGVFFNVVVARFDCFALSILTHLTCGTLQEEAWVGYTFSRLAHLATGAAEGFAVVVEALAVSANLSIGAGQEGACIHAVSSHTSFVFRTLHSFAWIPHTEAFHTLAVGTTILVLLASGAALSLIAALLGRAGDVVVDKSVAVVVESVADFLFGFGRRAVFPNASNAGFFAFSTFASTQAGVEVIDFAVAVVVDSITDLRFGLESRAADEHARFTIRGS